MFGMESILTIFAAVSSLFDGDPVAQNNTLAENNICMSAICQSLATNMLKAMDQTMDPCNNFYNYACGKWPEFNEIRPGTPRTTQFTNLVDLLSTRFQALLSDTANAEDNKHEKAAKTFYKNCLNSTKLTERGLDPLRNVLRENGGWPLLSARAWSAQKFKLPEIIFRTRGIFAKARIHPYTSEGLFFALSSVPAKNGRGKYLVIRPPSFFLPLMYLHDKENHAEKFQAYANYVLKVALELKPSLNMTNQSIETLRGKIEEMISFEADLAMHVLDLNVFSLTHTQEVITVRQFKTYLKQLDLQILLGMVGKGKRVDPNQKIIVLQTDYFDKLQELLKVTPTETVSNYVQWRIVAELISETTERMREIQFEFLSEAFGQKKPNSRHELCADIGGRTNSGQRYTYWGYAMAKVYAANYLPNEYIKEVNSTYQLLRSTLSHWFDTELVGNTNRMASQILESIGSNIGVPDWVKDEIDLDEFYRELNLTGVHHLEDHLAFREWQFDAEMNKYWAEFERHEWLDNPLTLLAGYDPSRSYVAFSAGFLTPPFYVPNAPLYFRLATLGYIMGHELTHGILRVYDEGNNNIALSLWDPFPHVFEQVECIVAQYLQLNTTPVVNYTERKKFSEDYADVGGFNLAYSAYKDSSNREIPKLLPGLENFNTEQLFFLSYAQNWCENLDIPLATNLYTKDIHSPGINRVLGVLRNSEEFSKAWSCPKTSFMNSQIKCPLWKRSGSVDLTESYKFK